MIKPICYSDYLDDQQGLGPASLWGYLVWHLLMHGDLLISDSWFANNEALHQLIQGRNALNLFERGFAHVSCRSNESLDEFVVRQKHYRKAPDAGLLKRIAGLPRRDDLVWRLPQVGRGYTGYLTRCFRDEPEGALRASAGGDFPDVGQVADIARTIFREVLPNADGILLRESFKTALLSKDPKFHPPLHRLLDQAYRLNFALTCGADFGARVIVEDDVRGLCDFLTGGLPLLSDPFAAHVGRAGKREVKVESFDVSGRDAKLPLMLIPSPAEIRMLGEAVPDGPTLVDLLEALEQSNARASWLEARHERDDALEWENRAEKYVNEVRLHAMTSARDVRLLMDQREVLARQRKVVGALVRIVFGAASASMMLQAPFGTPIPQMIEAVGLYIAGAKLGEKVEESKDLLYFSTREVLVEQALEKRSAGAEIRANQLITGLRLFFADATRLMLPEYAKTHRSLVAFSGQKFSPMSIVVKLLSDIFPNNMSLERWLKLNVNVVVDRLPDAGGRISREQYRQDVATILLVVDRLDRSFFELLLEEFPGNTAAIEHAAHEIGVTLGDSTP